MDKVILGGFKGWSTLIKQFFIGKSGFVNFFEFSRLQMRHSHSVIVFPPKTHKPRLPANQNEENKNKSESLDKTYTVELWKNH